VYNWARGKGGGELMEEVEQFVQVYAYIDQDELPQNSTCFTVL